LADYKAALNLRGSEKAYLGAVNAHILLDDFDAALSLAREGSKKVASQELSEKLAALEKGNATDSKGRDHKTSQYDDEGKLVWAHITQYESGRISVKTSYNGSGIQTAQYQYAYDSNGNCLKSSWYFQEDGILLLSEQKYDAQSRLIEKTGYGNVHISTNKGIYEYDENGRKSKETYWPDVEYINSYFVSEFEWTAFGAPAVERRFDETGELADYSVYEYNDKQQCVKETYYKADGSVDTSYRYEYDESGKRAAEKRFDADGNLVSTTVL
jgi:YD repeat-containing protein